MAVTDRAEACQLRRTVQKGASCNGPCRSMAESSYPSPKSGAVVERSNPTSKERWLREPRGAPPRSRSGEVVVRRYPLSKVRAVAALCWSSHEEIPHVQGKRNLSKTVGVARGHQRADTLEPYSQKISQSDHMDDNSLV